MGPMEYEVLDTSSGKLFILGGELYDQFMEVMKVTGLDKYFTEEDNED